MLSINLGLKQYHSIKLKYWSHHFPDNMSSVDSVWSFLGYCRQNWCNFFFSPPLLSLRALKIYLWYFFFHDICEGVHQLFRCSMQNMKEMWIKYLLFCICQVRTMPSYASVSNAAAISAQLLLTTGIILKFHLKLYFCCLLWRLPRVAGVCICEGKFL